LKRKCKTRKKIRGSKQSTVLAYWEKWFTVTYGRRNLRLKPVSKGVFEPKYLSSTKDRSVVEATIGFYESCLGKRFGDIDWEELRIIIGDDRLFNGLRKVMSHFYKPKEIELKTIANPKSVKIKVFKIINEKYGGFVNSSIRSDVVKRISEELKIPNIDEILWADDVSNMPLVKIREPSVEEVVSLYNFETLDTVFVNSSKVFIKAQGEPEVLAKLAKKVGRECKFYGLIYDMKYFRERRTLNISVEGPYGVFGKPTKYGSRLSILTSKIISTLKTLDKWVVYSKTHFRRNIFNIRVLSDKLVPELKIPENVKPQLAFDSEVEKKIYYTLKAIGFNVVREPEPIALGDLLYIPDFKVEKGGVEFLVEIVGFWRKEYVEKKMFKLAEVAKFRRNIIVLADEKLESFLSKLKIPVIYYSLRQGRPVLPYRRILEIMSK